LDDDRELWERICRGDSAAFDGFYREHGARLRNFLRQLLGDAQTAEDVMQETFLQLWRKPNGFHPENGTLRCYVFGIGRKRAADWWRQFKPSNDQAAEPSQAATMETSSLLSDALRTALLAHALEIPVGTVRSRLFAAREALRKVWRSVPTARKEGT
jgi:RNA polymerase sigma-70 factor, ECF subfamily